ncbi:MAG: UPF0175 family protein [Treponema sp.]|nr:UPF0175 family protein [Treponema sp.]
MERPRRFIFLPSRDILSQAHHTEESMADTAITFTVSREAARYVKVGADGEPDLRERAMLLHPAIADMTISHGRAAQLLGIPRWDLIELYAAMGIPYLTQTWEEAEEDSRAIEEALRQDGRA